MTRAGAFRIHRPFLLPALALVAACATPRFPGPEALRDALSHPRLQSCDELVCYYSPIRHYAVRNVRCRQGEAETIVCAYQRSLSGSALEAVAPSRPLRWVAARTELRRAGRGWMVVSDSDD